MECTLTVENTGNDCLNAVAQKLELREVCIVPLLLGVKAL